MADVRGELTVIPGDGGRRSRRGFAYQDAVTLLACLDMEKLGHTQISWEDLEDIQCASGDVPIYKQVKTQEGAQARFSIAAICRAEKNKDPHTSILGKLFSGKPLPDGALFTLIVNETPNADLYCFLSANDGRDRSHLEVHKQDIVTRLTGLAVSDERDLNWCVDRFEIEVRQRDIEDVENDALRKLEPYAVEMLRAAPLISELDNALTAILTCIAREARAKEVTTWTVEEFQAKLQSCISRAIGVGQNGELQPLIPLRDKLAPTGVSEEEADRIAETMTRFRRLYRSSVGLQQETYNDLSDDIHAICTEVMAKRRGGEISAGAESYMKTLEQVKNLPQVTSGEIPLRHAHALLSDITARCQNRYADAS